MMKSVKRFFPGWDGNFQSLDSNRKGGVLGGTGLFHRFEKNENLETDLCFSSDVLERGAHFPMEKQWKKDEVTASFIHPSDSDVIRTGTELMGISSGSDHSKHCLEHQNGGKLFF